MRGLGEADYTLSAKAEGESVGTSVWAGRGAVSAAVAVCSCQAAWMWQCRGWVANTVSISGLLTSGCQLLSKALRRTLSEREQHLALP